MIKKLLLLVFSVVLLLYNQVYAVESSFIFRQITLENGLSNSNVNCIVQDSNGFIWIGTENGLNRYDGYKFTYYYSDANKTNSLFSNEILTLFVDSKGYVWVGTFHGLFRYNEKHDNFDHISFEIKNNNTANIPVYSLIENTDSTLWIGTLSSGIFVYQYGKGIVKNYTHDAKNKQSLSSDFVFLLHTDSDKSIWIGTTDNGLDRYDKSTDSFFNTKPIEDVEYKQNVNAILEIFEFDDNNFLVGTRGDGLFLYNKKTNKFSKYNISLGSNTFASTKEVYNIYRDSKKRLWISSHGEGLFCFDNNGVVQKLEHENDKDASLINNNIRTIFEDRQGNLWIVSYQGGINILPNKHKKFTNYSFDNNTKYTSNIITAIETDTKDNIWVGTDGGGLKYVDRTHNVIKNYYPNEPNGILSDKVVMSLLLDKYNLWIGTYLKGIAVYNLKSKKTQYFENTSKENSLSNNFISYFLKTSQGDMWIGTNGGGIDKFNSKTKLFTNFKHSDKTDEPSLVNDNVNTIAEDNNGRLWIGTYWGLSVFDPLNGMFLKYMRNENDKESLSNNTIITIKITLQNEIWLGTRNGLNKFIPARNSFKSFSLSDGLSGNVINSIEEDKHGNLWLSTNNGICHFNTETYEAYNYYVSDGLPSNEFFRNASHISSKGELFFGSLKGLVSFYPDSIAENSEIPKPIITQFQIFNQPIIPGQKLDNKVILTHPIYKTDTIILKHKYNSFAFEFAALDFLLPEKNTYMCKMEGFDSDWRILDSDHRYVTYTNLDAGTYKFKVKASSIDNNWSNDSTNISVIINPPLYRSWWAFVLYYLIVVALLSIFWIMSIRRVKLVNQVKMERLERAKAAEFNQAKLQFFTNISHEFRTPITLIVGPLEKMLQDKVVIKKYKKSVDLMLKNANRLLRLVNQLMDLRKVETGKMKLKTEESNIIVFLRDIFDSFQELSEQKKIEYRFLTDIDQLICWFDSDKLDKIFFNLLSNAFKFTNENGEIAFHIEKILRNNKSNWLKVSVIDTGKGIAEKDKPKIFDRFYQPNDLSQNYSMGSGVGLSLTQSLVMQHYGEISFISNEGQGTEFYVYLPIDANVYADEEKFSSKVPGLNKYIHLLPEGIGDEDTKIELTTNKDHSILIVEDNYDLRKYLVAELNEYFNIFEAENGKIALDIALNEMPDLIISDVLMPEMDGLVLCKKIKENFLTNHIPVVLLTARASIEHRIKGIEQGADSYIPKPFNPEHLKIRVKKLLELRQVLKQKYVKELNSPETPMVVEEDVYLRELKQFVLDNLDNSDLNIENICKEMGISRAHFYRKIKLLTDKSPTEFVRIIKLNEAAKLLVNNDKSISEVCYMVGFNSPSYFSICFKEHFNISPIDFVKRSKKG